MPFALNSSYFKMYPDACGLQVGMNALGMPTYRLQVFICERVFVDEWWVKTEIGKRAFVTHIPSFCSKKKVSIGEKRKKKKGRKENGIVGAHAQI